MFLQYKLWSWSTFQTKLTRHLFPHFQIKTLSYIIYTNVSGVFKKMSSETKFLDLKKVCGVQKWSSGFHLGISDSRPRWTSAPHQGVWLENQQNHRSAYLAYPMMRLPNTVPIPAPEPATPTVAAPAPMNLAAVSMSRDTAEVWKERLRTADRLTGSRTFTRKEMSKSASSQQKGFTGFCGTQWLIG